MKKQLVSILLTLCMVIGLFPTTALAAEDTAGDNKTYEVSTAENLSSALTDIEKHNDTEATIVLKADVTLSNDATSGYISFFGANGKHITVKSDEGEMKKLSFLSYGVLNGDCTFDNVNVTGSRLFCNGYRTIFTENGQIHLSETLYGGGYKTTVNSTYVVIAASGYINPSSSSGLHDVIGGSYQGSVEGDTYLEITGDIQMQGGNHLNPGCMKGDGSSGDGRNVPDVYVGGNATLIYDNNGDFGSYAIAGRTLSPGLKERSITLNTADAQSSGYVLLQILVIEKGLPSVVWSKVLCVPPTTGDPELRVHVQDTFCPESGEELTFVVYHGVPCELTVTIEDEAGQTVRRLSSRQASRPEQLSAPGSTFCWNGTDSQGKLVNAGLYRVRVKAYVGTERYEVESGWISLTEMIG